MKIKKPRPRGRPRAFDREQVLDRAIIAFWAHGYDGTSIDILTDAMGINRPSLYATFGSKHDLFLAAIDRYASTLGIVPFGAFSGDSTAQEAVAEFFRLTIECSTTHGKPRGCLVANVATERAENDPDVQAKLAVIFADTEKAITTYFEAASNEGKIAGIHEPNALARMAISVSHSISARARAGANRQQLAKTTDDFLSLLFPI